MKLKAKPERLGAREFKSKLEILRLWPTNYRNEVAGLIRHIAYLDEHIGKLESEIREFKQIHFLEEKVRINTKPIQTPVEKVETISREERIYKMFTSERETLPRYLRVRPDETRDNLARIANEYANAHGLPTVAQTNEDSLK